MKTLILLTAAQTPEMIVGLLPSLGGLTDTYYPGTLRAEGQPDVPYPLIFSKAAQAWGRSFYVWCGDNDDADAPEAGPPQNLQSIDCLIVDLTAENAGFDRVDAMLRELFKSLQENGEKFRLLLLCETTYCATAHCADPAADSDSGFADLPFLLSDTAPTDLPDALPGDPVDLDTLCGLIFPQLESNDLDSIYEDTDSDKKPAVVEQKRSVFASIFDWVEIFCVALVGVILLMTFVVRRSPVEGSSMYPTLIGHNEYGSSTDPEHGLKSGYDDLLISNLFYTPKRLDIVIIQEPSQLSEPIVKRIIGVSGDRVKINFNTWEVYVNGELLDEPYVNKKDMTLGSQLLKTDEYNCWEGTVPEGCIFVLGDNRSISKDSRSFGYIDERYIIGKVIFRISPLDRFGTVED